MRYFILGFFLLAFQVQCATQKNNAAVNPGEQKLLVPLGGNTWSLSMQKNSGTVTINGIANWKDPSTEFISYLRLSRTGSLKLQIKARTDAAAVIAVSIAGESQKINIHGNAFADYDAGKWKITDTGYIGIHFTAVKKSGDLFAVIQSIVISGTAVNESTAFVKNNEGNFFYWGRRGPSVHLNYQLDDAVNAEWFYNEITVPEGMDVIGSYFMADGFAEGYFGIQVNSATERRILFSVWSPFHTDDPKLIPDSQKIVLVKKGPGVYSGEFGNEGSGGQSYLRHQWKAGITYGFLLRAIPDGNDHTIYTAYFLDPGEIEPMLIASFRRPGKATYLKRLHSFLENFSPEQGRYQRTCLYTNQWIKQDNGDWKELNKAMFTGDNTAAKNFRMDYAGGVNGNAFFLRNGGFFDQYTPLRTSFERPLIGRPPSINFNKLQ